MNTKKILGIIFSSIFICAFTFLIVWGVINFKKIEEGMSGTGLYTREDLDSYGKDMYNLGIKDREEYLSLIEQYRNDKVSLTDEISKITLENKNKDKIIELKNEELSSLTTQLVDCQNELALLKLNADNYIQRISELEEEVVNLRSLIVAKDKELNSVKSEKTELLKTIKYYEAFISQLETETQTVASFEYNGSIISIQILEKGSYTSIVSPADTDYVKFNYWMVNNQEVDLKTYPVLTNTKFVANITKYYDVVFESDGVNVSSSILQQGSSIKLPQEPTKTNHKFVGWSLNGVDIVNFDNYIVDGNVTFKAVFKELVWDVVFMNNNTIVNSQRVNNNNFATPLQLESTSKKVFLGWSLDRVNVVDVNNYPIVDDCVFYAVFEYYYDVKYYVNDTVDKVEKLKSGSVLNLYTPTSEMTHATFVGWYVNDIKIDSSYVLNSDIELYAKFEVKSGMYVNSGNNVGFISWQELIDEQVISVNGSVLTTNNLSLLVSTIQDNNLGTYYDVDFILDESITEIYANTSLSRLSYPFKSVKYSSNLQVLGYVIPTISDKFVVPSSVVKLTKNPFIACSNLSYVYLPSTVTVIDTYFNINNSEGVVFFTNASESLPNWQSNFLDSGNLIKYDTSLDEFNSLSWVELLNEEISMTVNANTYTLDLSQYGFPIDEDVIYSVHISSLKSSSMIGGSVNLSDFTIDNLNTNKYISYELNNGKPCLVFSGFNNLTQTIEFKIDSIKVFV